MKPPRELLLERNRVMDAKLDAIRNGVVRELKHNGHAAASRPWIVRAGQTMWMELFYPCRRAWLVLGCAWCAIVLLNVAARETSPTIASTITASQVQVAFAERRRALTDLNAPPPAAEPPKNAIPNRRSERARVWLVV